MHARVPRRQRLSNQRGVLLPPNDRFAHVPERLLCARALPIARVPGELRVLLLRSVYNRAMRLSSALPLVAALALALAFAACAENNTFVRDVPPAGDVVAVDARDVIFTDNRLDAIPLVDGCALREPDDGNGVLGTSCPCLPGAMRACFPGAASAAGVGPCRRGTQRCEGSGELGRWGACTGAVAPAMETCNNIDEDCNGMVDDGVMRGCYFGPPMTDGVGICRSGMQSCSAGMWGTCTGQVVPGTEDCNGRDDDCNGVVDDAMTAAMRCSVPHAVSMCTAGMCVRVRCETGYDDCDRMAANGCETSVLTDAANCGMCGVACPMGLPCMAGRCSCAGGGSICAGRCVDIVADTMNCGTCGNVCAAGQRCVDGVCRTGMPPTCSAMLAAQSAGVCLPTPPAPPRDCTAADLAMPLPARRIQFDSTGADQSFVVPVGVTSIVVKMWGAGGGSTSFASSGGSGGAGAFVLARVTVTAGESLTVIVGRGGGGGSDGISMRAAIYGGGGLGGFFGTHGGGRSAIRRGTTELATVAGGGGGASCSGSVRCGDGGAGGVARGEDGSDSAIVDATWGVAGTGATHACGGTGGYTTCGCGLASGAGQGGSQFQGGSTIGGGPGQGAGGGGGGSLGGGSGGGDCGGNTGGGGGGGSSDVSSASGCGSAGMRATPGNAGDPDRGTAGAGSPAGMSGAGRDGRVVVYY